MNNFKKFSLVACFSTVVSLGSIAQTNTLPTSGGVGIGTTAPRSPFEVKVEPFNNNQLKVNIFSLSGSGSSLSNSSLGVGFNLVRVQSGGGYIWKRQSSGFYNGSASIFMDTYGTLRFATLPSTGTTDQDTDNSAIKNNTFFSIGSDGVVKIGGGQHYWDPIIGIPGISLKINGQTQIANDKGEYGKSTIDDPDFRLSVNGKILATGVKVSLSNTWPDYVFKKDYKLNTLEEVEQYILTNSHLPDVPSEQEVKEKGIELGDMNAILLRKVEELTLYMIQLKKDNELLKAQLELITK
jgi:hypothetical protein